MAIAHNRLPEAKPEVTLAFFFSPRSGRSRRAEGYLAEVLQRRRNHDTFKVVRVMNSIKRTPHNTAGTVAITVSARRTD